MKKKIDIYCGKRQYDSPLTTQHRLLRNTKAEICVDRTNALVTEPGASHPQSLRSL